MGKINLHLNVQARLAFGDLNPTFSKGTGMKLPVF